MVLSFYKQKNSPNLPSSSPTTPPPTPVGCGDGSNKNGHYEKKSFDLQTKTIHHHHTQQPVMPHVLGRLTEHRPIQQNHFHVQQMNATSSPWPMSHPREYPSYGHPSYHHQIRPPVDSAYPYPSGHGSSSYHPTTAPMYSYGPPTTHSHHQQSMTLPYQYTHPNSFVSSSSVPHLSHQHHHLSQNPHLSLY